MSLKHTRSKEVNRIIKALLQNQATLLTPVLGAATATSIVVSGSATVAGGAVVTDNNQIYYEGESVSYDESPVYVI